ncbi:MAG TPA: cupin domain-containing protein [Solirubrobacterales bacterium]|nr:cupin domain-containing protein [Solirubrobacterales bacterium]
MSPPPDAATSPPATDEGTVPNLRFSFADAHNRVETGGWAREVTERELPVARELAGVNMALEPGAVRELHWHEQAEWACMLRGRARITAVDEEGRRFLDDVGEGDLWYFPAGIPHSIQALPEGCEFLLVFDDGGFSENATFLVTDWLAHTPREALAKNFGVPAQALEALPGEELYIFPARLPRGAGAGRRDAEPVPEGFSFRLGDEEPLRCPGGTVRIADSRNFSAAKTVAAALVEVEPGRMREMHWHPNADEWQYYLAGEGRMSVFAASERARTFDFAAGDVGYVPFAMGHYIENTGPEPLRFLELFRSDRFADVSLNRWLALTPPQLVRDHLHLGQGAIEALDPARTPVR